MRVAVVSANVYDSYPFECNEFEIGKTIHMKMSQRKKWKPEDECNVQLIRRKEFRTGDLHFSSIHCVSDTHNNELLPLRQFHINISGLYSGFGN